MSTLPAVKPCPNDPPCLHPDIAHDIDTIEDPKPMCCAEGCDCGKRRMDGDLVEFLRARLDEDEAEIGPSLSTTYYCDEENGVHLTRDRALREIAAGRELIKRYERAVAVGGTSPVSFVRGQDDGYRQACLDAISDRATVYSDHPDFREEWKS